MRTLHLWLSLLFSLLDVGRNAFLCDASDTRGQRVPLLSIAPIFEGENLNR